MRKIVQTVYCKFFDFAGIIPCHNLRSFLLQTTYIAKIIVILLQCTLLSLLIIKTDIQCIFVFQLSQCQTERYHNVYTNISK